LPISQFNISHHHQDLQSIFTAYIKIKAIWNKLV